MTYYIFAAEILVTISSVVLSACDLDVTLTFDLLTSFFLN